jgi:ribonuclease BN (tRNA processing enzyme)
LLLDVGPLTCYTGGCVDATSILISHFHHDHWSGLISLLGLKKCRDRFDPVHIYSPRGSIGFLKSFLSELRQRRVLSIVLTSHLESLDNVGNRIPVVLHSLEGNQSIKLDNGLMMSTFYSSHHCEALGFRLSVKEKNAESWTRLLTYTGDTSVEGIDDDTLSSPVLITECTYLESDKTQRALERGHMSLDNIVDIEPKFEGHTLLLIHFKGNYTDEEINDAIEARDYSKIRPEAICTKISDAWNAK